MTEAVTPPPPSPTDPPWPPPEKPGDASGVAITAADIRDGAAVALAVGVAGVLLGVLWAWLAPRVQYVSNGEALFLRNTESEARIGADGTFLLLSAALGAVSAVGAFVWRRRGGIPLVIGLAVGSGFAALVGWRLGLWLGPSGDLLAAAVKAGKGVPFDAPLQLLAHGALLVWSVVAVLVHLVLTAVWGPRDPEPGGSGWGGYYAAPSAVQPAVQGGEPSDAPGAPPQG
ncbi:DUF2567 domain-containing protein [Streptomyces sp. ISL-86]|uniref:DUF2567 domain-containing protein n=1 Tax=Streptomyces sp. ISL-86 TaxID=2819187 RepID=UPI0020361ED5|nr:DUF2567 domain-containing protein [Streptomyces sp. ISL-86]